jgi:hypothetical protein
MWRPAPRSCTVRSSEVALSSRWVRWCMLGLSCREFFLAPSTVAVGDPVAVYTAGDPQLPQAIKDVEFVGRAFGVKPAGEDRATTYRRVAQVRADEFAAHLEDEIIDG